MFANPRHTISSFKLSWNEPLSRLDFFCGCSYYCGPSADASTVEVMARASEPQGESFMRNLSRHGRQGKTWGHLVAAQEQTVGCLVLIDHSPA